MIFFYTENSDKENTADDDHNIDLPTSSISQASIGEDSSLENRICENKIASPGIHNDDDSSSIETVLDPRLYPEALKEESQRGYNIQGIYTLDYNDKQFFDHIKKVLWKTTNPIQMSKRISKHVALILLPRTIRSSNHTL